MNGGSALSREGLGLGLRISHHEALSARADAGVDFFEVIAENIMGGAAPPLAHLMRAKELAPVVLHGVGLNLLGPDPLDRDHLLRLKSLADRLDAPCVTDHLCWTAAAGRHSHDLLPAVLTPAVARYAAARARMVQDVLERPFGLENLAAMLATVDDALTEWEFLGAVVADADCGIVLDVNNIWVSARNQGFNPRRFLSAVDPSRILYAHVAGQHDCPSGPLVDTHDAPVRDEVWALYAEAWDRLGPFPTLVEWDANIPSYDRCLAEVHRAREIRRPVAVAVRPASAPRERAAAASAGAPPAELVSWQHGLMDLLAAPLAWAPPRARAIVEDYDPSLVSRVRSDAGLGAVARLRAYHEQVWFRHVTVLQDEYPTVVALLGTWAFNELAVRHLVARPPRSWDVSDVATDLGVTLAGSPWDAPHVREAAAVDGAWIELLRLAPTPTWRPPSTPDGLARARLLPAPTTRRLILNWPMPDLRDAVREARTDRPIEPPPPRPETWLLARTPDLRLLRLPLECGLAALLALLDDLPLGEALAVLERSHGRPELPARVRGWLAAGVELGWWATDGDARL